MSVWRRRARELFPERVADRGAQLSAAAFFAALGEDLRAVYAGERAEPDLEERAFAFAEWSLQPRQAASLKSAAIDGLLLHLPTVDAGRRAIAKRLQPERFADLEPRYRSALPAAHFLALQRAVASARAGDPNAAA